MMNRGDRRDLWVENGVISRSWHLKKGERIEKKQAVVGWGQQVLRSQKQQTHNSYDFQHKNTTRSRQLKGLAWREE